MIVVLRGCRMLGWVLFLHILTATVWTGGHLVLAIAILPGVLKTKSPAELLRFEKAYERIGIPSLLVLVVSGAWLAYQKLPDVSAWLTFADPVSRLVGIKLILLGITFAFAIDARLRLIPRLTADRLGAMAWHIIPVTIVSVLFVFVGVSFRGHWIF